MLKQKKSQIKVQETAFVLLALILLFGLILIFYVKFQFGRIEKIGEEKQKEAALSLLEKIPAMPELKCGMSKGLCIDKDKAIILKDIPDYEKIWQGLSRIEIRPIYPSAESIIIYSKGTKNITYSTFVNLCEQEEMSYKCGIAKILVSTSAK